MPTSPRRPRATLVTDTELLQGLRDPRQHTIWTRYLDRYRPVLLDYARRVGLDTADAEDFAQETLVEFYRALRAERYDRGRGRLRAWLFGIARRQLASSRRRRQRDSDRLGPAADGTAGDVEQLPDGDRLVELWEQEWREAVVRRCLEEVRREVSRKTFDAFQLFAWRGWPAQRVALELGITENAVFLAKRRVLRRIRELQPLLEEVW